MTDVEVRAGILMGEACLQLGRFYEARREFETAGAEMPKDRLIDCGTRAVERGELDTARALPGSGDG